MKKATTRPFVHRGSVPKPKLRSNPKRTKRW